MNRTFDNPHDLPQAVLKFRLETLDPFGSVQRQKTLRASEEIDICIINSVLLDDELIAMLSTDVLPEELLAQEQYIDSKNKVQSIPGWATWDEAQALTWGDDNIGSPLATGRANLPATLTLATTRLAILAILDILDAMWTFQRAAIRMLIALRYKNWRI